MTALSKPDISGQEKPAVNETQAQKVWHAVQWSQDHCAAWTSINKEDIFEGYRKLEQQKEAAAGLYGLAFGVKDNIDVAGMATTCGSPLYENDIARFDASCVSVLRAEGAVPVGKTVTAEFAYRQAGPTVNPWGTAHTPGGSSSGSAAAVACGAVDFALGTQTGGSVTRPAAYCGVLGFKPTRGLVHRGGVHLLSDTLDTIGWFARSVSTIQRVADVLLPAPAHATLAGNPSERALQIAVIRAESLAALEPDGQKVLVNAIDKLIAAGVKVHEINANPIMADLKEHHWTIMAYEMARGLHAEFSSDADRLSKNLIETLEIGRKISGARYREARHDVIRAETELLEILKNIDFILTPSAPGAAPPGLISTGESVLNRVWSVLGWPALHLPTSFNKKGLPLGVQLVGRGLTDHELLQAASALHPVLDSRLGTTCVTDVL